MNWRETPPHGNRTFPRILRKMGSAPRAQSIGIFAILLAAAVATTPLFLRGASCGHDFDFHLSSWMDAQNSWRHGLLYPHWSPSSNFGAGEPRFVFYPPLTWMLGALLGFILPWTLVPAALTFLLLAGTGLTTRALARQALAEAPATLAGCLALFSGYALFTAYERTAYGELAGGVCIPLLLLFALRHRDLKGTGFNAKGTGFNAKSAGFSAKGTGFSAKGTGFSPYSNAAKYEGALAPEGGSPLFHLLRSAFDGSALPLALTLAAAWLSNAPLGVMACYLLAFVALTAALAGRSWAPLLRAALAAVLGLALAAIYILPAAYEQRWVNIGQATDDPGERIENSFLFAHHSDPALAFHDTVLQTASWIATVMLAGAFLGLIVAWRRGQLGPRRFWLPLALIPTAVLLLQLPVSLPLWELPKLRYLQFPWRWLVTLEAPTALFVAAAVWPGEKARRWQRWALSALCAVCFVAATAYAAHSFYQLCDDQDNVAAMASSFQTGAGFQGTDEYAPLGADQTLLASSLPAACLVGDARAVLGVAPPASGDETPTPVWNPSQRTCEGVAVDWFGSFYSPESLRLLTTISRPGFLILRLRTYPAWRIRVNGQKIETIIPREDGLIAIPVPQGQVDVTVRWTATPDVLLSRWISGLAVLLLTGLWFFERRSSRAHLS